MKVLMISTDRNIFMEGTEVRERMVKYGRLTEELHIIVFSKSSSDLQLQKIKVSEVDEKNQFGAEIDAEIDIAPGDVIEVFEIVEQ